MNRTTQQTQQQIMENDTAALAAEMFDHFCSATTMRQILGLHRNMCDTINLRPGPLNEFYPKLKSKVKNWKAQALWKKFDARASHRVYNKGTAAQGVRVFVIGAGPCGLRAAIEAQLLGAKVVVVEKRDRISRNNVLHLWPFLITDLRNLGAKKFYGKFCAGAIDHISIRQLQCILLKVALLLGVEIHEGISFVKTIEPNDGCGWRAQVTPEDHAVSHYEFDVLLGADGKRNTLDGFRRKEFRGKLAIAITANFINKKTEAEACVEEISGVAFIFNQSFFKELYHTTGIDLENIVYYKDETHYFVMTAKKHSLLDKGVIIQDYADPAELLKPSNVNTERLSDYAQEAAGFSTKYQMPNLEFAVNHYGKPDVAMFDFTSMFAAENSSRVTVRKNYRLLQCLVGDSLLEPFWPTGSGCARGFLSSMDAAYAIKLFANHSNSLLAVLAQRESIYRLLAQTTPENLQRDIGAYTLDPASRYPNLNRTAVSVYQVRNLLDSDDPSLLEQTFVDTNALSTVIETPIRRKRRTADTVPLGTVLLRWIKSQLIDHAFAQDLNEVAQCFTQGNVLCALINRYRPDLIAFSDINNLSAEECNEKAFNILEHDLGIPRALTATETLTLETVDPKVWLNYLEHVCEVFRGEIPHVKHPKLDFEELREKNKKVNAVDFSNLLKLQSKKLPTLDNGQASQSHQIQRRHFHYNQQQPIPQQHHGAEERHQQRTRRSTAEHNIQATVPQDIPRRAKKRRTYDKSQNIDRERGIPSAMPRSGLEDQFSDRIKSMEQRITGKHCGIMEKKPKDLLRAIGKIESNDWNVKEIEKKIEQSKKTEVGKNREKVPKWSREQFLARQNKMSKPLDTTDEKYKEIDTTIKALDKQLKDPVLYERGRNKVASIAGQFVKKNDQEKPQSLQQNTDEKLNQMKQSSKVGIVFTSQNISEVCHFCKQRVYLMEKITAEGLVLHRSCLKCNHCHTNLRLGGYAFDRENPQGLFYCTQHYRLPAKGKQPPRRPQARPSAGRPTEHDGKAKLPEMTDINSDSVKNDLTKMDLINRGQTPERIEFENADLSDGEPSLDNVIDENEWTDRNFGTGTDASESDITSSDSDSDDNDSDMFEEAIGSPLGQTLQIASDWIGKQRYIEDTDDDDSYDSSDDEEAETQTEGEELAKARELRMQEVKLRPPLCATTTDTETEAQSDSDSSSPDVELNSATEISTDSEFDLDPVTKNPPQIYIDDSYVKKPTKVQIKQGVIENGFSNRHYTTHNIASKDKFDKDIHLKFKPLVQVDPDVLNTNIQPFKNPRPGDYLLNKTPSTEGIASKKSLELKKRYLLGETNLSGGIQKSGSTSILDSKLKNFHSNISECQKLLNPAAEISPSMQMFLRNTKIGENKNSNNLNNNINDEKENIKIDNNQNNDKKKVNETINTTLLENKIKDLGKWQPIETIDLTLISPKSEKNSKIIDVYNIEIPSTIIIKNQEFIESLDIKSEVIDLTGDTPVLDRSLEEQNENFNATIPDLKKSYNLSERTKNTIDLMFDKQNDNIVDASNDDDSRPRSPVHETTIHVPTILSWEKVFPKNNGIETDSLSSSSSSSKSSSTSSIDEIPHYILDSATSPDTQCGANEKIIPPRVEIRDTTGELMQIDSLMIINGKYVGDPEDLKLLENLPEGTIIPQQVSPSSDQQIEKCDNNDKSRLDNLLKFEHIKPDLKFDTRNENKIDTLRSIPTPKILNNSLTEATKVDKPKNLKFQEPGEVDYKNHDYDKTPTIANPNPGIMKVQPIGNEQNSDSETEATGQALTETELSDWTADDAVSENFVDIEFALNSNKGTIKRNKKKKRSTIANETLLSQSSAKIHNTVISQMGESLGKHLDFDNIEFMDTGSEESCIETYSTTNKTMLKNRGYVEFVEIDYKIDSKPSGTNNKTSLVNCISNKIPVIEAINKDMPKIDFIEQGACILNNDYDLKTPINEPTKTLFNEIKSQSDINQDSVPNDIEEDSLIMFGSQTTTTTEDSDALTVVTSPLDSYPLKLDNLSDLDRQLNSIDESKTVDKSTSEIEKFLEKTINSGTVPVLKDDNKTPDEMSYEEYVRELQTKIREISSARDSLDMRKSRRKSSKGDDQSITNPSNQINTPTKTLTIFNTVNQGLSPPTVTKKLEEITKQRTKQKDLIHDLVMDKLQSKKQLNAEKRLNRSRNRNMFCSPSSVVSHNPNGVPNEKVIPIDRGTPPKMRKDTERRHSLNLSTSPMKNDSFEKGIRPLSDYLENAISTNTPPKLSKTQSFCITPTTQKPDFRTPIIKSQQQSISQHYIPPLSRIPVKNTVKHEEYIASTEKYRQEARARARLKSNEDLGLSPEEKINLLRKRYNLDVIKLTTNKSDDMKFHEKRLMSSKSVNDITTAHKLASDLRNSYIDSTPKSQPQTPKYSKNFNFIDNNIISMSSSSSSTNNTNQMGGGPTNKVVIAGKEPRRGIIQTVSDFFYKKKDSGTTKDGLKSELRFGGIFKLAPKNRSKEKYTPITHHHSKSENWLKYENYSPQSTSPEKNDDVAPPIPPLPVNYQRSDDENFSVIDKEITKKFRSISKASRQGELKRLRIAQEIQREQEEIEVKVKELEARGVALEKALRGESQDFNSSDSTKTIGANDERLVQELLEIWRNITDLKKHDEELGIRQKELQLEHRHAQLKEELNVRLSCNKLDKSSSDIAAEGAILNEMLDIVAKRAALRPSDAISGGTPSVHSDDHTEI